MRKTIAFLLFFCLSFYQIAYAEVVSGRIEKVSVLEDGRIQLDLTTEEGTSTFFVDSQSLVQESVSATQVKKGQTILIPGKIQGTPGLAGIKGVKGMDAPFGNLSPAGAKTLGLPNVPAIPSIPNIPNVPKVPDVPNIPKVPQVPGGLGEARPPAAQKEGGPAEPEIPELPQDAAFQQLNPNPISSATEDTSAANATPKRVLSTKQTKEGIKVKLEGDDNEVVFKPEEKVFQLMTVQDLKQDMDVKIEADGPNARQITIV